MLRESIETARQTVEGTTSSTWETVSDNSEYLADHSYLFESEPQHVYSTIEYVAANRGKRSAGRLHGG